MLTERRTPYELLFRISPDGVVSSHAAFRNEIFRDGVRVSEIAENAMTMQQAAAQGFPLETILSEIHIATDTMLKDREAELAVATSSIKQLEQEKQQVTTERNAAAAKVVELTKQIEELTKPAAAGERVVATETSLWKKFTGWFG